jgi:hypothetical protein
MDVLLQWIGAILLLTLVVVFVPVFFMAIITLQFWLSAHSEPVSGTPAPGGSRRRDAGAP